MKTIVYPAYNNIKSPQLPDWMTAGMKTVEGRAAARGFDCEFMENRRRSGSLQHFAEKQLSFYKRRNELGILGPQTERGRSSRSEHPVNGDAYTVYR